MAVSECSKVGGILEPAEMVMANSKEAEINTKEKWATGAIPESLSKKEGLIRRMQIDLPYGIFL